MPKIEEKQVDGEETLNCDNCSSLYKFPQILGKSTIPCDASTFSNQPSLLIFKNDILYLNSLQNSSITFDA